MIVCQLTNEEWVALTPSERDAVRLGFNTFEVPAGASIWFENEWAWLMQLQRYDKSRSLEFRYTGVWTPVSLEEHLFHKAFARWLSPEKEIQRTKNMLQRVSDWVRQLVSGFSDPSLVRYEA